MNNRMELFKHLYPEHLHENPMAWHNFKFYVYPVCNEMLEALIKTAIFWDNHKHDVDVVCCDGFSEEYNRFENELDFVVPIIEKATNKTWDTIKKERET